MSKIMEEALLAFFSSDLHRAYDLCRQAEGDILDVPDFIIFYAMLCFLGGKSLRALNLAGRYRDICRAEGAENVLASFMIALGNTSILQYFKVKTGKELPLYDLELVYTTEDEILVPRGRDLSEFDYTSSSGVDFFWQCVVDGTEGSMQDFMATYPEILEETIDHNIKHKRAVMDTNMVIVSRIGKEETVLDLGSGQGQLGCMLYAADSRCKAVMVDVVPEYIEHSRKYSDQYLKGHNYTFVAGDILNSEWLMELGTFDVIVACDLVEHLYNDEFEELLKTVMPMLNVNGRFYLQTPNGLRYLGKVTNDKGEIIVDEFLGKFFPHLSERSIGYYMQKIREHGYNCNILDRPRIILEIFN